MQKMVFQAPGLYADHHVIALRRQLLALPGVVDVYASSAFFVAEVTYDEATITPEVLQNKIDELGYSGKIPLHSEE